MGVRLRGILEVGVVPGTGNLDWLLSPLVACPLSPYTCFSYRACTGLKRPIGSYEVRTSPIPSVLIRFPPPTAYSVAHFDKAACYWVGGT